MAKLTEENIAAINDVLARVTTTPVTRLAREFFPGVKKSTGPIYFRGFLEMLRGLGVHGLPANASVARLSSEEWEIIAAHRARAVGEK